MTDPRCNQIDEYLCGWLAPEEAAEFQAHLADCPTCREQCAVQRRIDGLLADGAAAVEPIPVVLTDRIDRGIRRLRRRRIGWACALTAAGIVAALAIWRAPTVFSPKGDGRPADRTPVAIDRSPKMPEPIAAKPQVAAVARVTLVDPSSAILVPVESHSPNVTVVRIYPTVKIAGDGAKPSP